ncbi:uncharacterized protein LOC108034467 [Drosophila biarmipes]|uniref:uncharacterized protein LOC108034467 n=1 Tax=Drosophila biarmipes TaxID=125945 RepID=UPI0007E6B186|nr:uncharacterized protein LOC108034467 [Drosophila biarmipes]
MPRLRFIFNIVKFLRLPLHFFGLLQLRYSKSRKVYQQRANFCRFLPAILISLILFFHKLFSNLWERENKLVNSLNIEKRPLRSGIELWNENLTSIFIFVTLIWSLVRKNQLWKIIDHAQSSYKELKTLMGKNLILECSWHVCIYGILLLILLTTFGVNIIFFNWPKMTGEHKIITLTKIFDVSNYVMGLPRFTFVLIMALHIVYHLISAGWLRALNKLRLQRNLKMYQFQLRNMFSLKTKMNILAGHYFKISYICYLLMVAFQIVEFLQFFRFDSNELVQRQKSQEDLDDEADWEGQESELNSRDPQTKTWLILSWHLALWMLLLAAAYKQQDEYSNMMRKCWNYKLNDKGCEIKDFLAQNSWKGHTFKELDILDFMFLSEVPICDRQPVSICFMTTKLAKKNPTYINLDIIAGHFKLLLNLFFSASIVYFVQQLELGHLQEHLKQES